MNGSIYIGIRIVFRAKNYIVKTLSAPLNKTIENDGGKSTMINIMDLMCLLNSIVFTLIMLIHI